MRARRARRARLGRAGHAGCWFRRPALPLGTSRAAIRDRCTHLRKYILQHAVTTFRTTAPGCRAAGYLCQKRPGCGGNVAHQGGLPHRWYTLEERRGSGDAPDVGGSIHPLAPKARPAPRWRRGPANPPAFLRVLRHLRESPSSEGNARSGRIGNRPPGHRLEGWRIDKRASAAAVTHRGCRSPFHPIINALPSAAPRLLRRRYHCPMEARRHIPHYCITSTVRTPPAARRASRA
jgi:hypothetical protein